MADKPIAITAINSFVISVMCVAIDEAWAEQTVCPLVDSVVWDQRFRAIEQKTDSHVRE